MKDFALERGTKYKSPLFRWTAPLLSRAAQRMRERFEERVGDLGLKAKHYGLLIALQEGPLTQTELGRVLEIDRTTMVALVDELEILGLLERAPHQGDRRAHAVTLTPKGAQFERAATRAVEDVENEFFAALSGEERAQLRVLLEKVLEK